MQEKLEKEFSSQSMFKKYLLWSKHFEKGQIIFELADGLGIKKTL